MTRPEVTAAERAVIEAAKAFESAHVASVSRPCDSTARLVGRLGNELLAAVRQLREAERTT